MILKRALPPLALLLLSACSSSPEPQPIPVLAEAPVSGLSAAAGSAAQAAGEDGLPASDALTATEQAIQLDELIKWVRHQHGVDNNPKAVASPPGD